MLGLKLCFSALWYGFKIKITTFILEFFFVNYTMTKLEKKKKKPTKISAPVFWGLSMGLHTTVVGQYRVTLAWSYLGGNLLIYNMGTSYFTKPRLV